VQAISFVLLLLLSAADYESAELVLMASMAGAICAGMFKIPWHHSFFGQRLDWDNFFETHKDSANFKVHIQMGPQSFLKLLSYI